MRLIVFGCLAALAACRAPGPRSLDAAAAEYVRLAREDRQSGADYVRALASLQAEVAALEERDGRRVFLGAQLRALEQRARFVGGERLTIRAEAASLGLPVPVFDSARAGELRARLDSALPGEGTLGQRLAGYHQRRVVPRAQLDSTATRIVSECRARSRPAGNLHDAGVEMRYVLDQPWPAFTTYQGNGQSLVEVRRDVAWTEDTLREVLCHETYPGHHLQNLVWAELNRTRGWVEFSVVPPFTPHALMAERAAVAATRLLGPQTERPDVQQVLTAFAPLATATAVDIVDGAVEREPGLNRLRDELVMPNAEAFVAFVEEYRSMTLAYVTPATEITDWQSYLELLRSPARLVAREHRESGRRGPPEPVRAAVK